MVNPVGGKKASYRVGLETGPDPDTWLAASQEHKGSWWEHWIAWLTERSGEERPAPAQLGNPTYPPLEPAPGTYVRASAS